MPVPFQIALGLLGGLGVGSLLGVIVQGVFAGNEARKQRAHDREMRELAQKHELDLRLLEHQQRLRDLRLARLREGFLFLVQALLQMEEVVDAMERKTEPDPGEKLATWQSRILEANRKADQARAGLLLDEHGEAAMRRYVDLTRALSIHLQLIKDVHLLQEARSQDLPRVLADFRKSSDGIINSIVVQIRQAQDALAKLEAPISLDSAGGEN